MKKSLSLVALLALAPVASAAEAPEAVMKRVASFSTWDSLLQEAEGEVPALTLAEVRERVRGTSFPQITLRKSTLTFRDPSNGQRIALQSAKNLQLLVNQQPWRFRPLASVNEQLLELQDRLAVKSSLLDFVPRAEAVPPLVFVAGLYAVAAALDYNKCHKVAERRSGRFEGERARQEREEFEAGCFENSLVWPYGMIAGARADAENLVPVNLKCPAENGGVLEVMSRSGNGQYQERIRAKIANGGATELSVDQARGRMAWRTEREYRLSDASLTEESRFRSEHVARYANVLAGVCADPAKLTRYRKELEENSRRSRPSAAPARANPGHSIGGE